MAYTITPAGQSSPVTMYAQCYQSIGSSFTGDPGLILYGFNNNKYYVWNAVGAAWVAAIASPDGSSYDMDLWYSVGLGSSSNWDSGSYGVAEVYTNASKQTFEMTAAGLAVGYCGVQFASDGTNTYGIGSSGGSSCGAQQTLCLTSSDESTSASGGICSAATPFSNTVAIGIASGTGISNPTFEPTTYPVTPNVTINGTATDAVHFGPSTVPSGLTKI